MAPFWALSRLPMRVLYVLSDIIWLLVYHVVRYRRRLVRRQLRESFPEKEEGEIYLIERRFYHFLCDYFMETLKLISMPHEEILRRVRFYGLNEAQVEMKRLGRQFLFFYLGHYGNWEWIASYSLLLDKDVKGAQIYHPLRNKMMDDFFLRLRSQFGGVCIPMKETLRQVLTVRGEGRMEAIGFIADQSPKWEAMHHWTRFLNHDTSFFIGTEKIGKQVDACIYYVRVTRPCRGRYDCHIEPISTNPKEMPDFEITDRYAQLLEEQIREEPELWLWTHNRWKRTKEEWLKHQEKKETNS